MPKIMFLIGLLFLLGSAFVADDKETIWLLGAISIFLAAIFMELTEGNSRNL